MGMIKLVNKTTPKESLTDFLTHRVLYNRWFVVEWDTGDKLLYFISKILSGGYEIIVATDDGMWVSSSLRITNFVKDHEKQIKDYYVVTVKSVEVERPS